jgi:cation-transporting ATPase E
MHSLPSTDPLRGLSAAEVAQRVARGEVNRPPRSGWAEYRDIVVRNVVTLFNALVVPAAAALFVLQEYRGAWAVSGMAVTNTLIALVQEVRAKRHLDQLALLTETRARVCRDGQEQLIPAGDVVLGDCVLIAAGEAVVTDGTVLAARFLEVDEALLTGESDPVPRRVGDRLLSGSFCVAGDGSYLAEKVGAASFAQQTSAEARRYRYAPSPMQRILDTLIRVLTATAVVLCLLYVVLYYLRGFPATDLWQMIAATVTSMVPQGLVLMTTLAFTLAALRMSTRGALVQRLSAVESMASVDVLCMDKTGTLTTGRLRLDQCCSLDANNEDVRDRLRLFAWASIDEANKSIQALRTAMGVLPAHEHPEILEQIPFKSQNRYSAVHVRVGGKEVILVLGAFETLRPNLVESALPHAEQQWHDLLSTGLRLLLFAEATCARTISDSLTGLMLRPLAVLGLSDELRPEAAIVLEALASQGIRFKILSGDNPETVRATIASLRLPLAHETVATGAQLDVADALLVLHAHSVFGRVSPQQKLTIIRTLQDEGQHVAMLGDGVNDLLAIKRADLGIAMGAGSSATKTVAALVLESNDFAVLPVTLDEGRIVLHNLRRAAKLFLLKNVYTLVLIVFALGFLRLDFPYLPQQVTLLNAVTIGGPALLLMLSRQQASARPAGFLREVGWFAVAAGLAMGLAGLAVWLWSAWGTGDDVQAQRTLLLTTLVLAGLGNVLLLADRDARLLVWTACALPAYIGVMVIPATAYFFALSPLSLARWLLAAVAAALAVVVGKLFARQMKVDQQR